MGAVKVIESQNGFVWSTIRSEAQMLHDKEPLLRPYMDRLVSEGGTFEEMLATRLADLLQAPGISAEELSNLFSSVMAVAPDIATAAMADLQAVKRRDPACPTYLHGILNLKGYQALQAHRLAHNVWVNGRREIASLISNRVSVLLGVDIHPAATMGGGIMLDHGSGIVIGETSVIDDNVSILQNVTLGGTGKIDGDRHPKIRHGVLIGAGASVLGNVEVGECSKIAAGSVVLQSVPRGCTVAGVPAKVVRIHDPLECPAKSMEQGV